MTDIWAEYLPAGLPTVVFVVAIAAVTIAICVAILNVGFTSGGAARKVREAASNLSKTQAKHDMQYEEQIRRYDESFRQQQVQTELLQQMVNLLAKQNELLGYTLDELRNGPGNQGT